MAILKRKPFAKPISVSCVTEGMVNGVSTGELYVTVIFQGRCIPRPMFGDAPEYKLPEASGGIIDFINYFSDADISAVKYQFRDTWFRSREEACEKFRNKMLAKIAKNKNENIK